MTKDVREYIKFQKAIAALMLWGVGVIPMVILVVWEFELIAPYASIIAIIAGIVQSRYARALVQQEIIHDWRN